MTEKSRSACLIQGSFGLRCNGQGHGCSAYGLDARPIPLLWLTELRCICRQDVQVNVSQEPSTSAPDSWLVFEVTDTGCGIAKEGLHALFNDYVQASQRLLPAPICLLFSVPWLLGHFLLSRFIPPPSSTHLGINLHWCWFCCM